MNGEARAGAKQTEDERGLWYRRWLDAPRRLVLLDAIGALVTAALVGLVLPWFEPHIGLSRSSLHVLGAIAAAYTVLSFYAFFLLRSWHIYLRVIGLANLGYVAVTLAVLVSEWSTVTGLGLAYFAVEIAIIVGLSCVELTVAGRRDGDSRG